VLLKLAWRNIWRNKRRTVISVAALALGVTAIVSMRSMFEVSSTEMARGITTGLIGHEPVGTAAPILRPWYDCQATRETITQKTMRVTGAVAPTRLVSPSLKGAPAPHDR